MPHTHTRTYLSSENPTHSNNAEDVEDSRADNGSYSDVTVRNEHTCERMLDLNSIIIIKWSSKSL